MLSPNRRRFIPSLTHGAHLIFADVVQTFALSVVLGSSGTARVGRAHENLMLLLQLPLWNGRQLESLLTMMCCHYVCHCRASDGHPAALWRVYTT